MAHASVTQGDTATLVFLTPTPQLPSLSGSTLLSHGISNPGTSVRVYRSQAPSGAESRLKFSVHGADVGSYQPVPVTYRNYPYQLFWTSPISHEVSHTLVITVDPDIFSSQQGSPLKQALYLDYFTYQTTSTAGKTAVIGGNGLSVTYSPKWNLDPSDSRLESTRHVSNSQSDGPWAAVSFGTGILVFGALGSPGPDQGFKASVAIDESQSGTISESSNSNQSQTMSISSQLFDSGSLPSGPHTITSLFLTAMP